MGLSSAMATPLNLTNEAAFPDTTTLRTSASRYRVADIPCAIARSYSSCKWPGHRRRSSSIMAALADGCLFGGNAAFQTPSRTSSQRV